MITNNYWRWKTAMENGTFRVGNAAYFTLVNMSGVNFSAYAGVMSTSGLTYGFSNMQGKNSYSIALGSGTTKPTTDDYQLANNITGSFSSINIVRSVTYTDGKEVATITITGQNNTASSLTISEIGFVKMFYKSMSASDYDIALMLRHVLDEPLEVPSGHGFTITVNWDESETIVVTSSSEVSG